MDRIIRLSGSETEPVKLDLKDKKIMAILVDDARISITQLAKKVGLKRETADYRIKRLIDQNLITGFAPMINFKRLGYSLFEIFILFRESRDNERKKLIERLAELPYVKGILEYSDRWDVKIEVIAKDLEEFDEISDEIQENFEGAILEKERSAFLRGYADNSISELFQPKNKVLKKNVRKDIDVKIDDRDLAILKELSKDCRQSTYLLGEEVGMSADGVGLRIKKMVDMGIIEKFATWFDNSKLPLYWYTFAAELNNLDTNTEDKISKLVNADVKIMSARKVLGGWDILFSIVAGSQKEIHESVRKIKEVLSGSMRNYQTWLAYREPYFTAFPEILLNKISKK